MSSVTSLSGQALFNFAPAGNKRFTRTAEQPDSAPALRLHADSVELSSASRSSAAAATTAKIARPAASTARQDRITEIKAQIQSGAYDIDSKLDIVADRILKDLNLSA